MNKKFSTLLACALLAGSFSNVAYATNEIPYRTQGVMSEQFDGCFTGVRQIIPGYYYQLQVNANGSLVTEERDDLANAQVLTQVRDYQTGNLILKVVNINEAPLTASLWKIDVVDRGLRGKEYVFTNRETGYTINYDCADANVLAAATQTPNVDAFPTTIIKDDNVQWEWYTDEVQPETFGPKKVWSYTHEGNVIMGMVAKSAAAGTQAGEVVAVKINKSLTTDEMANMGFITLAVRTAGAKVLNAADINSMIDASGSWRAPRISDNQAKFKAVSLLNTSGAIIANDMTNGAYLASDIEAVGATATFPGANSGSNYFGYNILLNKKGTAKYLMVATDETYESAQNPTLHGGLKVLDAALNTADPIDALYARYIWKATYYATNDSLVLEPMNASVITTALKQAGTKWAASTLASANINEYYNTVNAGSTTGNNVDLNGEYARKGAWVPVALTAMNETTGIDSKTVLTVGQPQNVTVNGHIQVGSSGIPCLSGENHANQPFCYPVARMNVKVSFDNTYLPILNRTTVATGIYNISLSTVRNNSSVEEKRVNGAFLVADYAGHYRYDVAQKEQNFAHMPATQWVVEQLGCAEGGNRWVKVTNREFASQAFLGQLYTAGDGKVYIINHNYTGLRNHANVATPLANNQFNCADTLMFHQVENPTIGYLNIEDNTLRENKYAFNLIEKDFDNQFLSVNGVIDTLRLSTNATNFEFFKVAAPAFGYKIGGGSIGTKYLYKVKVTDANKVDNDHKWIAFDNNHKFVVAKEADINAGKDGMKWAVFAFKENSESDGICCYTLVNHELVKDETLDDTKTYCPTGVLAKELQTADTKLVDLCAREYDVFDIQKDSRPLYMNMRGDVVVGDKYTSYINSNENCVKFSHMQTLGSLYESSKKQLLNYLALENLSTGGVAPALYVDEVAASVGKRMPQYLIAVRPDSVGVYKWCKAHGINSTCDHSVEYQGYVAGSYLVNLNDSIHASIDKLTDPSKFHSDNYTRLAFVEAIHQGNTLYVLKAPYTIQSISAADPLTDEKYVVPTYLEAAQEGIVYDKVALDGSHNNVAFAFRYVGDTEEDGIMLESYDVAHAEAGKSVAGVGSFTGAWVTLNGAGVPVLGKFYNVNGDHDTDDTVDGSSRPVSDFSQVITQSAIFTLNATEGPATDNEAVELSGISVIAGYGSVRIVGAAGKTVAITNILGQAVANKVITSNDATISTPKGIVVVAVEGEEAVKAIIK